MKAYDPAQLPAWYLTPGELADHWRIHPDRVLYCIDAGIVTPAALVPKASLPFSYPGPAPHVVVMLDGYGTMDWRPEGDTMVAPLVGEFRAFSVDRGEFSSFTLAGCDDVFVSRRSLVIPWEQCDELSAKRATMNPTERRSLLLIIGALVVDQLGNDAKGHYTAADAISNVLQAAGIELSERTIAEKLREAFELYTEATKAIA